MKKIADRIRKLKVPHVRTREPTDGLIGQLIRSLLKSPQPESPRPVSDQALTPLFAADKAEHFHGAGGIIDLLADVDVVIKRSLHRFQLGVPEPARPRRLHRDGQRLPGCVIFLTTPVDLCQERLRSRAGLPQRFDDSATQRRLLAAYDAALKLPMIDAALARLLKLSQDNDVCICTKPLTANASCASDKYSWDSDKIGMTWVKRVSMTTDNTIIRGDYLIDDRPVAEGAFEPTWRHVLYSQPYNRKFGRGMTWTDHNDSQVPFEVFCANWTAQRHVERRR